MIPIHGRYASELPAAKKFTLKAETFLPNETTAQIKQLLKTTDSNKILTYVKLLKKGKVKGSLINEVFQGSLGTFLDGKSEIKFKKMSITIDNETGRVIDFKKPFWAIFTTLTDASKKVETFLKSLGENFNNPEMVEKGFMQTA